MEVMDYDIEGRIYLAETVENKARKFGSWKNYVAAIVVDEEGNEHPALFTRHAIERAVDRAKKNPEDLPEATGGLFDWLFG
jgi:hypothetical protein